MRSISRQRANGMKEAEDQSALPHPRLGFFGVIDERFDVPLLRAMADAHPEWQLVMVGPVVKIDPASLPRNPNIHYFGQRSYQQLPSYLKGWDVCLLPFARNVSTKFISPTKTLEYMAAGKMIVSTPITDVAEPYGEIVYLGGTPEEFIGACEQALTASGERSAAEQERMKAVLSQTSWDSTADAHARTDWRPPSPARQSGPAPGRNRAHTDHRGRGPDRAECCLSSGRGLDPAGTERPRGRMVPLDRSQRLHVRLCRPHHVLERAIRSPALPDAAGRQRALAGSGGVDLQQGVFTRAIRSRDRSTGCRRR